MDSSGEWLLCPTKFDDILTTRGPTNAYCRQAHYIM
jgi:hypothetical protein